MTSQMYELQIDHHLSGRYTLKQRESGEKMWIDLTGDLFANTDALAFYRAVINHVVELSSSGKKVVSVIDTSLDVA